MDTTLRFSGFKGHSVLALAFLLLGLPRAFSLTLTNDTIISPLDSNYDGADVVITNCTVTIDGPHTFSSLLVAPGGVLTHSFAAAGTLSNGVSFLNEVQTLVGTNPVTLSNSYVVAASVSVTDSGGSILYTNGIDYLLSSPDGILTQLQRTTNSSILDGTNVLVSYQTAVFTPAGLTLSVTGNVEVATGGAINAAARGYGGGIGSGAGRSGAGPTEGSGAGYGGFGGMSSSNVLGGATYGSFLLPSSLGSGGGSSYIGLGGSGGGLINIMAGGNLIVNGSISANGADATNSRSGGGSGGSISLVGHILSGSGSILANGGRGELVHGGGAGGGRVALQFDNNNFTGLLSAYGGSGARTGGAGTIYTKLTGLNGLLLVDNGGQSGTNTPISQTTSATDLLVRGNAGAMPFGTLTIGNLTVASNSYLLASPTTTLNITAFGNVSVQRGGSLLADGSGYASGAGPGAGRFYNDILYRPCGGGGYGGNGGISSPTNAIGGFSYGSQATPTDMGSGGGTYPTYSIGGYGGGAIRIAIQSGGFMQIEGRLSANGLDGSGSGGGGGSGGSIWISGGTLLGSGSITVNGGNGANSIGGGGGGGRMAIAPTANLFSGTISAYGGGGGSWGGAGTIWLQTSGQNPQLVLDNGGNIGTNTPIQSAGPVDLLVRNGAMGSASSFVSFGNLLITSNAWLTPAYSYSLPAATLSLSFSGNATIQNGGGIIADLAGYAPGIGPGSGRTFSFGATNLCGGAGHGGLGGSSFGNYAAGGNIYDTITSPNSPGSGGGYSYGPSLGGAGGGVIRLTVSGTLQLDGVISANGGNGSSLSGGGGSGGSIWISAGALSGAGPILANGGSGVDGLGGGGSGGMIYLSCNNNSSSGLIAAFGGGGANWGGPGTLFIQRAGQNAQLILDNGGHAGPPSPLQAIGGADLNLRNGSIASVSSSVTMGNLLITSNSWMQVTNTPVLTFSRATVQAGGGVIADGWGYGAGAGPGAGRPGSSNPAYPCGGAAHGGYGGNSSNSIAVGGSPYDSQSNPINPGSGGGSYSPYSTGGAGGGAFELMVNGLLQLDGLISANGVNGSGFGGGGGAGGSLWITANTLAGSGSISANGGNGVDSIGGGGSGGRIGIYPASNLFAGTISAFGGGGANVGGAGTIVIQPSGQNGQLIVDNGGRSGAPTSIQSMSSPAAPGDVFLRNGALVFQQFPPQTFSSILIGSNAWLVANPTAGNNYPGIVNLTLTGNATLQAGGGIQADASGAAPGLGSGAGRYAYSGTLYPCSGAGYGGYGGSSGVTPVIGGFAYGYTMSPSLTGSGGGTYSPYSIGGGGGGYVRLNVNGTLQVAGRVSANGGNGSGTGGGGGSGGSIWLTAGTFAGTGVLTANGGNGVDSIGGGGGGGRVYASYNSSTYSGALSAYGGGGANRGGAGTIVLKSNSQFYAQLTIDNGGFAGTNTLFDGSSMDLLVTGGGSAQWNSGAAVRNLQIRSNSFVRTVSSSFSQNINVTGNATIDAGGSISADGLGFGPAIGTGLGVNSSRGGGGAGHGGVGAGNPSLGFGSAYGSIQSPTTAGSGGGNGSGTQAAPYGGSGGGSVRLSVTGTLALNGKLSAVGADGDINSGGGAGGSLWVSTATLTGSGMISANGGSGEGSGGGGGGGRISLGYNANNFTGSVSAYGGGGSVRGGAGTIYTRANIKPIGQLLVDNGGGSGTNTPIGSALVAPTLPFDLFVANGAVVTPQPVFPVLNNLTVSSGGLVTGNSLSNLELVVVKNATIASGGGIMVDGKGFAQATGPGAGQSINSYGSGAGYGGVGGASVTAPGGISYGSLQQPVDSGSGGGLGSGPLAGGSQGGGSLRLTVGGALSVDGQLSAEGSPALQDNAGGGSGGSIWVSASALAGGGLLAADGGAGDLYGGGGGAGGRIALYSPANLFFGQTSAAGADGDTWGSNGTIFFSNGIAPLQITSHSPVGIVSNAVSYIDLFFNGPPDPSSFNGSVLTLTTPNGVLSDTIYVSMVSSAWYRFSFPQQTAVGNYTFTVSTNINDLFGQPLAQGYTGSFTISLPVVQGTVTDTNGQPVAGVLLQTDVGFSYATTDTNGNYSLGFPPGSSFVVTPSSGTLVFVPAALSYTNLTASVSNQNYLAVTTIAPLLSAGGDATNFSLGWLAIPGVTYQVYSSTNFTDWSPYGDPYIGSNGPVQLLIPYDAEPMKFFKVQSSE